jgi:hypothetical protein
MREGKMRFIMRFGPVAVAVAVVIALLAAPSAMAAEGSALCNSGESGQITCADGNQLGELHYESTEMKILSGLQNVTCESLFLGNAFGLFGEGNPVKIEGKFTYTNCNGSCVVEQLGETEFKMAYAGSSTGTMVSTTAKFEVECFFLKCIYNWEGLSVGVTSANVPTTKGKLVVTEQVLKKVSGPTCPMTTKLHLSMESLSNVWVKE